MNTLFIDFKSLNCRRDSLLVDESIYISFWIHSEQLFRYLVCNRQYLKVIIIKACSLLDQYLETFA
jgi:hypothetical protein